MKRLLCLVLASQFAGCYAEGGYVADGPVVYAGPAFYAAYPCDWGTCYYDGPRLVYYERAPVRSYYGGVGVHYYDASYVASPRNVAGAPEVRNSLQSERATGPVQSESMQPTQVQVAQDEQRVHAQMAQNEASRRAQGARAQPRPRQSAQLRRERQ
jgi:hypothetical protein